MSVGFSHFYGFFRHRTTIFSNIMLWICPRSCRKRAFFVPIIPHGISPPRQAFQPILIQIVSRPGSRAYLKSLWQRCHSLYRFGVQSRRSRFLRKYHYHLQIIAPGNAGSRLAHCLIAISPDSKDAYAPIGGGCDLLVWIVTATSCFGSLQMFV